MSQEATMSQISLCWLIGEEAFVTRSIELLAEQMKSLTARCWNNQAFMIFVAILGNIPLFFCFGRSISSSSCPLKLSDESAFVSDDAGEQPKQKHIAYLITVMHQHWNRKITSTLMQETYLHDPFVLKMHSLFGYMIEHYFLCYEKWLEILLKMMHSCSV